MVRVNRRFLFASPLLAFPIVLLMASLSTGTTPMDDSAEIQYAVPQLTSQEAQQPEIQQVAGRQQESPRTRPGLLAVIAGTQSSGDRDHHHKNMGNNQSRGLLDGIFGNDQSRSKRAPANHGQTRSGNSNRSSHPQHNTAKSKESVNWEGIPYHRPSKHATAPGKSPIVDPASRSLASQAPHRQSPAKKDSTPKESSTRVIRGGNVQTANARVASARTEASPKVATTTSEPAGLPRPPAEVMPTPAKVQESATVNERISSTSSSRRSERRDLQALEAIIERKPSGTTSNANDHASAEEVALVPRVVKNAEQDAKTSELVQGKSTESTGSQKVAATEPVVADDPVESNTAIASIGKPTPASEPASATDAALSATSNSPAEGKNYTIPVDPNKTLVPLSDIPSQPYAASTPVGSTPASAASHRAGPPAAAFQPSPYTGSPIGSGVVSSDDATANDPLSLEPAYQTARLPGSANDPYGSHTQSPVNRLTTNGQPVAEFSSVPTTASTPVSNPPENLAAPLNRAGSVPIHAIPGHAPTVSRSTNPNNLFSGGSDNFDRSTYQSRNQMRGAALSIDNDGLAAASELPGIRVVTQGPSEIMIRQTSQFEIRVENRGSIDAEGVLVRANVPDWADLSGQNASIGNIEVRDQASSQLLVWTIDQLPAGTSERMFVRLTAARSGSYDLDVDWTLLPQKSVTKIQVHEPRLDVTIEGPDEVVYGQSQTYKVHVLNPGDGTAPNVLFTLSPNSATPQTQRIGDIPAGKEAQFDVELTAQDLGDLKIHGLATGDLELRAEAAKTIRVAAANLEAMFNGPELKYQNSDAIYNLQVQNTGSVSSDKIAATLRLPAGVGYLGGIEEARELGNTLQWEITSLPPGATRNYQFTCKLTSTGQHLFAFDCKGTAAGQTNVSIATRVESIADLVLTVNDPPAPAPIGSEVTYEIVIRNRGSKEATDVRAVAQFSHGIEPQRIEGQSGEVVTGQVLFDPIDRIGAGQEVRLRVIAAADRGGHHRFRSEVRSGDTVLVAEEATHYMSPQSERVSRHSSDSPSR